MFETNLELSPWVQIDMAEGRYVKSITLAGKNKDKLTSIYIFVSPTCKLKCT